jgi:hypothetical protein
MDKMNDQRKNINDVTEEYNKLNNIPIDVTNNITHAEFVTGMRNKTIGFKCLLGEPCQLIRGARKAIFNILVMLYMAAPLIIIPLWAYHVGNWWLLVGIVVSYVASFSAANRSKIIFLFACFCTGFWILSGFSIYQYITFYFFCALWGYMLFQVAESVQTKYAMQSLIESLELFNEAIAQNKIMIVRRRTGGSDRMK